MNAIARASLLLLPWLAAQAADPTPRPLFQDFMGLNAHFTFKPELYRQTVRRVRNYHNLNWDVNRPGEPAHPPLCVNRVDWKADVYGRWKAAGLETSICLQFTGFEAATPGYQKFWVGQEQWCFDYGRKVASYFGPSGAEQLCTSFEIGNEPGAKFDPALWRSLFTQMAKGIRAGDPKAKIVTATAVAREGDDYAQDLRKVYADPEMLKLYDVINLHTYSELPRRDPSQSPWVRGYPETPGIRYLKDVDEAVAWRDQHAPGKEIWITEFGYDAGTEAAMSRRKDWALKLDWQGVSDLHQAQYLVRSFLLFAERDVARAYIYFFDDQDEPSVHGSSGLTRRFQPKPSFWAVRQLYQTLGDYRFERVVRQEAGKLHLYAFQPGRRAGSPIWVAWSPTGVRSDRQQGYVPRETEVTLTDLPAQPARVLGMAVADGAAPALPWKSAGPRAITLTIGESPAYLVFGPQP